MGADHRAFNPLKSSTLSYILLKTVSILTLCIFVLNTLFAICIVLFCRFLLGWKTGEDLEAEADGGVLRIKKD